MADPLVLGFDTSGAYCAAALIRGDRIVAEHVEEMARGQAERLFPMLEEILVAGHCHWSDLSALGVGIGPGNFTGIRISVSAARGLGLSLGVPVVGVDTFEAASLGVAQPVTAVLDARRDRIYARSFPGDAPVLIPVSDLRAAHVTGPAADLVAQTCGANVSQSPYPVAAAIAQIARDRAGQHPPPPAPLYIRDADAAPSRDVPPVVLDDT